METQHFIGISRNISEEPQVMQLLNKYDCAFFSSGHKHKGLCVGIQIDTLGSAWLSSTWRICWELRLNEGASLAVDTGAPQKGRDRAYLLSRHQRYRSVGNDCDSCQRHHRLLRFSVAFARERGNPTNQEPSLSLDYFDVFCAHRRL